ncbi:MAG: hypothetical protein JST54_23435 [Deltaproteobacteria bacterium]|nr:hypothetical protein [Deltaproteobacteria bacterium]
MRWAAYGLAVAAPVAAWAATSGEAAAPAAMTFDQLRKVAPIGPFAPEVGQWVIYKIGQGDTASYLRIGLLSRENTPHGKAEWLEMSFGPRPEGGVTSMKYLTTGDPRDAQSLQRLVIRLGGGQPMELTGKELAALRRDDEANTSRGEAGQPEVRGEPETKQVTAGTFTTHRVEMPTSTLWISDDAPMFHLVAGVMHGVPFELYSSGKGAQDWVGESTVRLGLTPDGGMIITAADGGAGARP